MDIPDWGKGYQIRGARRGRPTCRPESVELKVWARYRGYLAKGLPQTTAAWEKFLAYVEAEKSFLAMVPERASA